MDREAMLARRADLRAQAIRVAAQLELFDELLGEAGIERSPDPVPPAKSAPSLEPRAAAPKADRPDPAAKPAGKPAADGYAERVAAALLAGPLPATTVSLKAGADRKVVTAALKGHPEWFRSTGSGPATHWELTPEGRQAASRASSSSPPDAAA